MKGLLAGLLAFGLVFSMAAASSPAAESKISGKGVEYVADGMTMKSYFAFDEKKKDLRPGVLVVPEWWGINDYAYKRARMLAGLGYAALAVDMYGEGKQTANPDEAGKLSAEVMKNINVLKTRFTAGMDFLKGQAIVDPNRLAAIGYCFGGGVVLNMARQGVDLKGIVSFHGSLTAVEQAKPGGIKAKILVLAGGDDSLVPAQQVEAFKKEMEAAGADFQVILYPGAKHSFTNSAADALGKKFNLPIAYNAEADKKSWQEMKTFFNRMFKK